MGKKKEASSKKNNTAEDVLEEVLEAEESTETEAQELKDEKEARIEELEAELASVKDSLLRKAAELENVRKRVQRERISLFEEAKVSALEDFLPINDDLLRTLDASKEIEVEKNFMSGIQMVADKFKGLLSKNGIERIDETGVPFDVNLHDALLRQPAPDKKTGSDIVLQILESGYKMGNKTIRHAKVIVSE